MSDLGERRPLALPRFILDRLAAPQAPRELHDQAHPLPGLKAARLAAGLTPSELAMRAGLTPALLERIEGLGHPPSPHTWEALARAIGVEPGLLLEAPAGPMASWRGATP